MSQWVRMWAAREDSLSNAHPDILTHVRDRSYPVLLDRGTYDSWQARSGRSLEERTFEQVEEHLEKHKPDPLPQEVAAAVHTIVKRAEAQYAYEEAAVVNL